MSRWDSVRVDPVGAPCGLSGCIVRVGEMAGRIPEQYRVRVCSGPDGVDCHLTSAGGAVLTGRQEVECCTCD